MTSNPASPRLLLIGASRGLGLAIAKEVCSRGWDVVGTCRVGRCEGLETLANDTHGRLRTETLDINDPHEMEALRSRLSDERFDILFVNAGAIDDPDRSISEVKLEDFVHLMVTNAFSPMRVIESLQSLVEKAGTIGVMSSELASIADNEFGSWEAFRASKAALNTLMRSYAARQRESQRSLVLMAPGWVRTDTGGPEADLSVEESAAGVVYVLIARAGTRGLAFLDYRGRVIRW